MNSNNKVLISCIVPIYKVPNAYLKKCIESIINQTLKSIEIILVDDGSPDNCGSICDNYAIKDKRIKVIHQKNKGLAGARNSGLDVACGEYVTYVDGDDYIDCDGLERLYEYSKKDDYDVIRGKYYRDMNETIEKIDITSIQINKKYCEKDEIFFLKKEVLNFNSQISSACGALYKTSLLKEKKIYNDEKLKQGSEDVEFSFRLYDYVKKAIFVDEYFYHYIYNDKSISAYSTEENNYRVIECFIKILENINKQDSEYYEQLYFQFNIRMLYVIVTTFISGYFNPKNNDSYFEKRKKIKMYLNQNIVKDALKYKYIKKTDNKRKFILFCIKCRMFFSVSLLGKIRYKQKH